MSLIQRLVISLLPKRWSEAVRAESETWTLYCPVCGSTRSVWEAGGIRYKAVSLAKRTAAWCEECGRVRMMSMKQRRRLRE